MFDDIMSGVNGLVEDTKENLLNARKSLEKNLIRMCVASPSHATSETRKTVLKTMEQTHLQELEGLCTSYTADLSTAVKGQWVTKAKQSITDASKVMNKE
ncbi:hypothetical protein I6N96_13730 [Enterococcus sp. BWM-S5]|uniref:Uncharacterized protein n=1 Tax=Enterococcus larvae TaxID=2794352 RepID=A0ABS4CL55_9ENTE|nr:hypothetical protein [Enterococcus larvae]MBP1047339.1 hypothetical protein [Enterococcus larvae]